MPDPRDHTLQLMRDSIGTLQRLLATERQIAANADRHLAERALADIPKIEAQIADAEDRVRRLERPSD
jgi:hypothetical protein